MHINLYSEDDLPALLSILQLNTPNYFHESEADDFITHLKKYSTSYYTLSIKDSKIIGGCGYYIHEDSFTAQISWSLIHPDHHGQGYGTKAVQHCFKEIKKYKSIRKIVVHTSQLTNAFFESHGFVTHTTKADHWGPGLDFYGMEMELKQ